MSTRRRIGISTATTETARRQLMQPVPCWEKIWIVPTGSARKLEVYKWVKTGKKQSFSDDENEPYTPLVPLPDIDAIEASVMEGYEDIDDPSTSAGPDATSRAVSEPATGQCEFEDVAPALPRPHPLSISLVPQSPTPAPDMGESELDMGLKRLKREYDETHEPEDIKESTLTVLQATPTLTGVMDMEDLDVPQLEPDGTQLEGTAELNELQSSDALLDAEASGQS